jgi:hydrogenase small subunit
MPGFPDKFMPFMDEPPGAKISTNTARVIGSVTRSLRGFTNATVNEEPKWRRRGHALSTGYQPHW